MFKRFFIPLLALIAMSCSQSKEVTQIERRSEQVHRYKTVYEGNRIIRHDAVEQQEPEPILDSRQISHSIPDTELSVEKPTVQRLEQTERSSAKEWKFRSGRVDKSKSKVKVKSEADSESGGGWVGENPGAFGLILYGGAVLFFWLPILAGLLGLAALVFAIIGAVEKNSQRDVVFSWVVIGLFLLGLLLIIIAAVIAAGM